MVQEEREREDSSEHQSEDADDEQELSKAASVIQMKYRQRLERRSRGDITLDNGNLSGKCMNLSRYNLNFYKSKILLYHWVIFGNDLTKLHWFTGKMGRHDSSSKTGCSSPTSDDSGTHFILPASNVTLIDLYVI